MENVKSLLYDYGLMYAWDQPQLIGNPNIFLFDFKRRVEDDFVQKWFSSIRNSNKLTLYKELKKCFEFEDYLQYISSRQNRVFLTKLRVSAHSLRVETGRYYDLNRIPTQLGTEINLNRILLLKDEDKVLVGQPYLENVKITARILEHLRGKKTLVYKMRPKKKTRKKQGHRQELTRVLIENIEIV